MHSVQEQTEITVVRALRRNQDKSLGGWDKGLGTNLPAEPTLRCYIAEKKKQVCNKGDIGQLSIAEAIFAHLLSGWGLRDWEENIIMLSFGPVIYLIVSQAKAEFVQNIYAHIQHLHNCIMHILSIR